MKRTTHLEPCMSKAEDARERLRAELSDALEIVQNEHGHMAVNRALRALRDLLRRARCFQGRLDAWTAWYVMRGASRVRRHIARRA